MILQTKTDGNVETYSKNNIYVLEMRVNNHPGMMLHICGLFFRRAYHMEKKVTLL
jgi:acetolactate synthase small subunit